MPRPDVDSNFIQEGQKEVNSPVTFFLLKVNPSQSGTWIPLVDYYKNLVFNGITYNATNAISREDIKNDSKSIPSTAITVADVTKVISQAVRTNVDLFYAGTVYLSVYTAYLDTNEAVISYIRDDFEILNATFTDNSVVFECQSAGAMDDPIPRLYYSRTMCRYYYKDARCDPGDDLAASPECSRTKDTCKWIGEPTNRFGGFKFLRDMRGLWV